MASQTNNLGTTFFVIFLITIFFTGLYLVNIEISAKNDKLDIKSEELIESLGSKYENNISDITFSEQESAVVNDSTFEGVDAYSRQYLEDKSEINQKKSLLNKIFLFPSILLMIFGVEDMTLFIAFSSLVYGLITIYIGLQVYKAIRTGEVD